MRGGARRAGRRAGRTAARRTTRTVARRQRRRRRRMRRRIILVGGLIALGAYKLSKKDVERVEEHTGKKAEDLTDEELEQAMDDLNIAGEEMTDEEWEQVEKAEAEEDDYIDQLERLAKLRDQGILTDEEFEAKKKQLLDL